MPTRTPGTAGAVRTATSSGDALVLQRSGGDPSPGARVRLLVVGVVRLGVAAMEALPLLRPEVGGPVGCAVLVWLVLSGTAALGAVVVLRGRARWPGRATGGAIAAAAAVDLVAYAVVATTSPGGYGPIVVLGMMLLAQAPMCWGLGGALLVGVPVTAVSLARPADVVSGTGGRVTLVLAVVVAVVLGVVLRRFLDREAVVRERTQQALSLVFDHSPTAAAVATTTGDLVHVNAAMSALTACSPGALAGTALREHVHPDDAAGLDALVTEVLAPHDGDGAHGTPRVLRLRGPRGSRWAEVLLGVVPAGGDLPARLVVQVTDVEDRRATAERLEHEASHDALTGLPNRRALHRGLDALVAEPQARGVLVLVDLDGFKAVNDGYGHEAGDDLLVVAAQRLRSCLRPGDVAARLAGDEMVVLARGVAPGEALATGRRVLAALLGPVALQDGQVELRASAGVRAVAAPDDARSVLRDADAALYEAKRCGGATVRLAPRSAGAPHAPVRAPAPVRSAAADA